MECDYTHSNHNSLVSPKKNVITKGVIIKEVYCTCKNKFAKFHKKYHSLFPSHLGIIKPIFNSSMISNDGTLGLDDDSFSMPNVENVIYN